MAYTSLSFAPNEILTSGKMNQVADNFAALRDGTGMVDAAILSRHILDGAVTAAKRSQVSASGVLSGATVGSTGNKTVSGLGFAPKAVRFMVLPTPSANILLTGSGYMDATNQRTTCVGATTTSPSRWSSTSRCIAWISGGSSTPNFEASRVSLNADGFTINVNSAASNFDIAWEAIA